VLAADSPTVSFSTVLSFTLKIVSAIPMRITDISGDLLENSSTARAFRFEVAGSPFVFQRHELFGRDGSLKEVTWLVAKERGARWYPIGADTSPFSADVSEGDLEEGWGTSRRNQRSQL
jgi:hypothetical protein